MKLATDGDKNGGKLLMNLLKYTKNILKLKFS
jgi:hypothetical protein